MSDDPVEELASEEGPETPHPVPGRKTPGLLDSLEAGLHCVLMPRRVFARFLKVPAPGFGAMILACVFWSGFALFLTVAITCIRFPSLGVGPLALASAGALFCSLPASFGLAGMLHVLALIAGGKGGFNRSYQAVAFLGVLAPVCAILIHSSTPFVWLLPSIYGTYLVIRALEILHRAPSAQAWVVAGACGAVLIAAEFAVHHTYRSVSKEVKGISALLAPLRGMPLPEPAAEAVPGEEPLPVAGGFAPGEAPGTPADPWGSLPMLRRSGTQGNPLSALRSPGGGAIRAPSPREMRDIKDMSLGMLRQANRQLEANPEVLSRLSRDERATLKTLMRTANSHAEMMQRGTGKQGAMTPAQAQQMLNDVMRMVGSMQERGMIPKNVLPPGALPGQPPKKRRGRSRKKKAPSGS